MSTAVAVFLVGCPSLWADNGSGNVQSYSGLVSGELGAGSFYVNVSLPAALSSGSSPLSTAALFAERLARDCSRDLTLLAFERLARMSRDERAVRACRILAERAPDFLVDRKLSELALVAFRNKAGRRGHRSAIERARRELKKLGRLSVARDKAVRRALLYFFGHCSMGKRMAVQVDRAREYFVSLSRRRQANLRCMSSLARLARAIDRFVDRSGRPPSDRRLSRLVALLVKDGLLSSPAWRGQYLFCPLSGQAYRYSVTGNGCSLECPVHSDSDGLFEALQSPFTFGEERRWHQENAVVYARTLFGRIRTRRTCAAAITFLAHAIDRYARQKKSIPPGNLLKLSILLRDAGVIPSGFAPLCPMDGRPYRLVRASDGGTGFSIECPNHGRLSFDF